MHGGADSVLSGTRSAHFSDLWLFGWVEFFLYIGLAFWLGRVFCSSPKRNVLK